MLYIENNCHDPRYNLAFEEYVFKNVFDERDILLLWQNEPSVIIGQYQNTHEEINETFISEHGINVVRRITGGGAVYHDLGNLNYSFITGNEKGDIDFNRFTAPLLCVLRKMGVNCEKTGRNDLTIDGAKFSGTAQNNYRGRILHHGTLLFDSDLDRVAAALKVKPQKIASKSVKSVRSRVTNIKPHLPREMTLETFKQALLEGIIGGKTAPFCLSEAHKSAIAALKSDKYDTWEWNFGKTPEFDIQNTRRFDCGTVDVCLSVAHGIVTRCKFYGDFFSNIGPAPLEALIEGRRYEQSDILTAVKSADIDACFKGLSAEELAGFVCAQ